MATKRLRSEVDDNERDNLHIFKKQRLLSLSERDLEFENDIKVHPYYLRNWLFYISTKQEDIDEENGSIFDKFLLYERSLSFLPGSYKLWYNYLNDRISHCKTLCILDPFIEETNNCFERCLTFLHKMPRIWMMYTEFLTFQRYITRTRKIFDRMLCALPITQHDRVWPLYLKFVRISQVPEMAVRVYRRYVQLYPQRMEEFIEYLIKQKRFDEACCKLCDIVNNDQFDSIRGKSKFDFWKLLCQLLIKNAKSIKSLNVDSIIRSGIKKYPQEIGKLWIDLAEYYVRLGQFEKARDIYNEAINSITSVKDFGIIFDSFARFEENIITIKMQQMDNDNDKQSKDDIDIFEFDDPNDLPLRIDRLEQLYKNRAILLSSVKLRQNPHNIDEWLYRVKIYLGEEGEEEEEDDDDDDEEIDAEKVVETFTQAIATIDPYKATGNNKLSKIWIEFGKFYEEYGCDLNDTRTIYKKGITYNFKNIDDLSSIWCEWAEMELRHQNYENCRKILKEAIQKQKLLKSKKLWSFAIDIEESMGSLEEIKSIYNKVIDSRIASVQIILNYADLLERNEYFEESYKIYERGIEIFEYPHVLPIWKTYLFKFINRYKDKKLERTRDLFEQCLNKCPSKYCKEIYLLYARFEEKYGFARHAMRVYDKACLNIEDQTDKQEMYHIYINRAADLFGITKTREIYEKAIQNLNQIQLTDICLSYISLELKLSEIDRARSIFQYCAQFANPKKFKYFWTKWHQFEINYGNEDSFKEMLRIRRSVDVMYTEVTLEIEQDDDDDNNNNNNEIQVIQEKQPPIMDTNKQIQEIDPNEIDIDADDGDVDNNDNDNQTDDLQQIQIPSAIYQSSKNSNLGALDRFNQ